ncbi:MAG: winged helix-turn-helix domain-containing protein [Alphaproteobacteria bacterium]
MARLSLRIDFSNGTQIGPGKVRLLELIGETGSIAAAGRALGMSYRRAWLLVDEMNGIFREPVVASRTGGMRGGGAQLTPLGKRVVTHYRAIETGAAKAGSRPLGALERALGTPSQGDQSQGDQSRQAKG